MTDHDQQVHDLLYSTRSRTELCEQISNQQAMLKARNKECDELRLQLDGAITAARRFEELCAELCGKVERQAKEITSIRPALERANGEFKPWKKQAERLVAENAKLRELVRELYLCSRQTGCDSCGDAGGCVTMRKMRDLGIEVVEVV